MLVAGFGLSQIPSVQDTIITAVLNFTEKTELVVEDNTLYMNGTITSTTPEQFKAIFEAHPTIDTLVMEEVGGSIDDEANLRAATWVAKKDLTFILEPDSEIASGGTDFFLAGQRRIVHDGAKVGVHSWTGDDEVATDFPVGDPVHQPYIDYYMAIGWSQEDAETFYYFTINAAPAEEMYWMSKEELTEYRITTEENVLNSANWLLKPTVPTRCC